MAAHGQASHRLAQRIVLMKPDNGRSVPAGVGDDVEVRLASHREQGLNYSWEVPQSSVPATLRRTSGGTTPNGSASAVFHQERPGTAAITAVRHCRPDPGRLCPSVVSPWKVTVTGK
ncbi:hypothetical protein [Streptomyces cinnamoneus]|uniref:hypothetical protein n=1 Tax=Streptomyces cinnamoneus TaxID=53446 RepID=UPI0037939AEE